MRPRRALRALGHPAADAPAQDIRPARAARAPRLIAAFVALAGLLTLLSAAVAPVRGRFEILSGPLPLAVRTGATSVAALAGFGLLVIAGALARRQRRAWWIALVLLIVAGVSHVLKDLDVVAAGVSLGMAVVLLMSRHEFDARPGPASLRRAFVALPVLAGVAWAFGTLAIVAHAGGILPRPTPGSAASSSLRGLVGLSMGVTVVG